MIRPFLTSVTRISDLAPDNFTTRPLAREHWATGDYVVGRVLDTRGHLKALELSGGRMIEVMEDDLVVGAFGTRAATLEAVGSWRSIDDSGEFNALTGAGLFGKATSLSPFLGLPMLLRYQGHVMHNDEKLTMRGCLDDIETTRLEAPIVLIVGTSMSAGKTTAGRVIVHLLSQMGLNVVGAKLTGAARYRDMLSFSDAGASAIFDFVDAGLPSTAVDEDTYREVLPYLLSRIAQASPDVVVAEAGASPLEPYNGAIAKEMIRDNVKFKLLCAQDPYAVVGVQHAFQRSPDLVAGGAANTEAAIALVHKLSGLPALNLMDPSSHGELADMLRKALRL
ncbi:MAG: DUF1611 domain-containing protein [Gammaproteobacteria bacterium]|nr:DUF1611 domain-containing protein [Gammaproteobacteria bacterium]MDH3537447.1 DUF1611 domain-containing protein [Gammaproteobacteria bacterium]